MSKKKSKNFDANMDVKRMKRKVSENRNKAETVLFVTANNIAPFDPYRTQPGPHLRQYTSRVGTKTSIVRTWKADYAGERYVVNAKNPHTTHWIEKGYQRKKAEINKIQRDEVIKK